MRQCLVFATMMLMASAALTQVFTKEQLDLAKQQAEERARAKGDIDLDGGGPGVSTAAGGLVGFWSGGECILTASSQGDMVHDVSHSQKHPQEFPLIISQRDDGQLQVDAHPMDAQLHRTLTYRIDGNHVHAEETSDQGVRGNIRDFTLKGNKLVGTYTRFDNYHRSRAIQNCELPKQ